MKLSAIVGQPRAVATLNAALEAKKVHHAWLFTGPRGVGKRTAALALAAAVNCGHGEPPADGLFASLAPAAGATGVDACGACPSCIKMASGNHPDLHLLASIERAEQAGLTGHVISDAVALAEEEKERDEDDDGDGKTATKSRRLITVNQCRALETTMLRMATEGRYKAAVIIDADQLNAAGANSLLKTIEEPMGASLIVLTTAAPSRLPSTIQSRCRRLRFMALPEPLVAGMLVRDHGVDESRARLLAHVADGSIGRALELEEDNLAGWALDAIGSVARVPTMTATEALETAADLGASGKGERQKVARRLHALFDLLGIYYRDAATGAWADGWRRIVDVPPAGDLVLNFDLLDDARRALDLNCSTQVTLEAMFMKMREPVKRRAARA